MTTPAHSVRSLPLRHAEVGGTRTLQDMSGIEICKVSRKFWTTRHRTWLLPPHMPTEAREEDAPVAITQVHSSRGLLRLEIAVKDAQGSAAQQVLNLVADYRLKRGVVLQGSEESGRVVARLSRGESHFSSHEIRLDIAPGVDAAVVVALAMAWSKAVRDHQAAASSSANAGAVAAVA